MEGDVSLTDVTYLKIVADQVHSFIAIIFPDGSGPYSTYAWIIYPATLHTLGLIYQSFRKVMYECLFALAN